MEACAWPPQEQRASSNDGLSNSSTSTPLALNRACAVDVRHSQLGVHPPPVVDAPEEPSSRPSLSKHNQWWRVRQSVRQRNPKLHAPLRLSEQPKHPTCWQPAFRVLRTQCRDAPSKSSRLGQVHGARNDDAGGRVAPRPSCRQPWVVMAQGLAANDDGVRASTLAVHPLAGNRTCRMSAMA